jgi:hypothetical protein
LTAAHALEQRAAGRDVVTLRPRARYTGAAVS